MLQKGGEYSDLNERAAGNGPELSSNLDHDQGEVKREELALQGRVEMLKNYIRLHYRLHTHFDMKIKKLKFDPNANRDSLSSLDREMDRLSFKLLGLREALEIVEQKRDPTLDKIPNDPSLIFQARNLFPMVKESQ